MDIEILHSEIERLFSLDELTDLSRELLGLDPDDIGSTTAKASFARALTDRCSQLDLLEALAEAVLGSRSDADPRLRDFGQNGLFAERPLLPGTKLADYVVSRRIGEGSASIVYAAQVDGEKVVLKVLKRDSARNRGAAQRFLTVARLLGKAEHSGLARNVAAGHVIEGDYYFVAYDDPEGEPLTARIRRDGPMHFQQVRALLRGALDALAMLHDRGLAHGNLKLNNIIAPSKSRASGQLVLVDGGVDRLGLAARLSSGTLPSLLGGTTTAPEQIRGQIATPRSDVYGLGAVLFEMLTGQPLFQGRSALDAVVANLLEPPRPPSELAPPGSIPRELDRLVLTMLSKEPPERLRDARAVLDELEVVDRGGSVYSEPTISENELDQRIAQLLSDPTDEAAGLRLESAVQEGADPGRVAQVVLIAADQASEDGLEAFTGDVRKNLLYRAARVYEGANMREEAEGVYAQIVSLDPTDDIAAGALQRIRMQLDKHEEVIEMLLGRAEAAGGGANKARLMAEIGRIYAMDLDDRAQALVAYVQAFCDDPQTGQYADEIERLAGTDVESWTEVTTTCAATTTENIPSELKVPLFLRLGRWYTDRLSRPDLGVACFQAILAVDPSHEGALLGLTSVYQKAQQWAELAQTLLRRALLGVAPSASRSLTAEAADLFATKLGDPNRARELYQQVLTDDPTHKAACGGLERILEEASDYPALVRVLEGRAESLRGDGRQQVLARIAEVYDVSLNDLAEATRRYEAMLEDDPTSSLALKGLDGIYTRQGRYKDLVEVLNREIQVAVTPRQRITLYQRLASVYEEEYLDHKLAAEACEEILELDPDHDETLDALARHYRSLERWDELAKTYERHLRAVREDDRKIELGLALGKVLAEQIGSPNRAANAYETVLELAPANASALEALAKLRAGTGESNLALQAIEALAAQANTPEAKAEQWMRAARLAEQAGDLDGAIDRYKTALDLQPHNSAASDALRGAYIARGDASAAVDLIGRQVELAEGGLQKAKLCGEMARIYKYKLNESDRASSAATQAYRLDPTNIDALLVLGDSAFEEGHFLEAINHLELPANRADKLPLADGIRVLVRYVDALYKVGESEKAVSAMESLIALAPDNVEALSRVARVAFDHSTPRRAYELYRRLLEQFRDCMSLREETEFLYRMGESARRASMTDEAFGPLTEAMELDPSAPEPLVALGKVYEERGDWENVVQILERRLDLASDTDRYDLLLEVADVIASKLKDRTRAAKAYVAALDERPEDRNVLTKLMQLYSEEKEWSKLVEVVLKLSQFVDDKKQKAKYLQTAAMVTARQLGDFGTGLEYYEHALELDPTNERALEEAASIRKQKGDFQGVETLLKVKLEHADAAGDQAKMLETFLELADLYHHSLGWIGSAIDAYEAAQTLDPDNPHHESVLAELYASDPAQYLDKAVAAQRKLLRANPDHAQSYKLLRKLYTEAKRADAAWCMCQALHILSLAEPDEERFFRRMRATGPAAARTQLNSDEFQQLLVHEQADPTVSAVFTLIEPAIVAARASTFETLGYDPSLAVDLSNHPSQLARMLYYVASVLGIALPPAFENSNDPGALSFLHTQTPSIVLGQYALTADIPAQTAAFIAARHIIYYRPGMYVRHLAPTGTGLRAWLFAAVKMMSPAFPVTPDLEGPVRESLAALDKAIVGPTRERLASLVSKLLTSGGSLDLKRWVAGIDLTADRAGLLLSNDLQVASEIVKALGEDASAVTLKERLKELVLFATDDPYFTLRSKLGLAIDS